MLNLLCGYIENSLPEGRLETRPSLRAKVDETGKLLPFSGNTTVFLLDDGTKAAIEPLQRRLYEAAGHLLAEPLAPDTFHMTLHDLANGIPSPDTDRWIAETEPGAQAVLDELKAEDPRPLYMKTTWIFNMVNTSIVLGLAPADPETEARLCYMYARLNAVVPLDYPLCPHITLAYFRPGVYGREDLAALRTSLTPASLEITLDMENLVLQTFTDMNNYQTV